MDNILDFMAKFNNETARDGAAEVSTIDANKRWKSDPISKAGPAYNFGVVKIRCKINGECPMWQAPRKEILLTFNKKTIKSLSEKARQGLDAVEGIEGVFLKPIYNYRHVFFHDPPPNTGGAEVSRTGGSVQATTALSGPDELPSQKVFTDPDYKKHYIWEPADSFFQDSKLFKISQYDVATDPTDNRCFDQPIWEYGDENIEHVKDRDTYFQNSTIFDGLGLLGSTSAEVEDAPETATRDWEAFTVQTLRQTTSSSCNGKGVHWHVRKQAPLLEGQDFFIEFYKKALSDDVSSIARPTDDKSFTGSASRLYKSLDVYYEGADNEVESVVNGRTTGATYAVNNAVKNVKELDFTNQAYYCVEMQGNKGSKFFIVLAQNAYPTFIEIKKMGNKYVSFTHSVFNSVKGSELIDAVRFRMTVRNHLGHLVVKFEGIGEIAPWVISYRKENIKDESNGQQSQLYWEDAPLITPEGQLGLWGGNMLTSFSFGFLQYQNEVEFSIPAGGEALSLPKACLNKRLSLAASEFQPERNSTNNSVNDTARSGRGDIDSPLTQADQNLYTCDADVVYEGSENDISPKAKYINFQATGKPLRKWASIVDQYKSKLSAIMVTESVPAGRSGYWYDFRTKVGLKAGSYTYEADKWRLPNSKTPIITVLRVLADQADKDMWPEQEVILTDSIMKYSESWSSQSLSKIDHQGTISFLMFPEMSDYEILNKIKDRAFYVHIEVAFGPRDDGAFTPTVNTTNDSRRESRFTSASVYGQRLYDEREGLGPVNSPSLVPDHKEYSGCNYTRLQPNTYYRLMTGICYGGVVTFEHGKRTMTCKIYDYSRILQDQIFLNAPFFDGYNDAQAIYQIIEMASMKSQFPNDIGYLLKKISTEISKNKSQKRITGTDLTGRRYTYVRYFLPDSWDKIQNPFFKFKDGEKFLNGVNKIAETAGQVAFFDEYGVLHYERDPSQLYRESIICAALGSKCEDNNSHSKKQSTIYQPKPMFKYSWNPSADGEAGQGQMMFKTLTKEYGVADVHTTVKIASSSIKGGLLMHDLEDIELLTNPEKPGFLGYRKLWWQNLPLGSEASVRKYSFTAYSTVTNPPYIWNFQTYGLPVRAKDIIQVNGEYFSIAKVTTNIDPGTNKWWQNIQCEWYTITPRTEILVKTGDGDD